MCTNDKKRHVKPKYIEAGNYVINSEQVTTFIDASCKI